MPSQVPHHLAKTLLILVIATLIVADARPNHFGDSNQLVSEQESGNLLESGLKPWQVELLLAQRLSELSAGQGGAEFTGWDKTVRSPEAKRQSRYRQCYFNPISCFRK